MLDTLSSYACCYAPDPFLRMIFLQSHGVSLQMFSNTGTYPSFLAKELPSMSNMLPGFKACFEKQYQYIEIMERVFCFT